MKISTFFDNEYVNYSSYDNLRKIASFVDGQKNASRKVLYTILEKNIRQEIKVSQLGSKTAEFADYLHGNMDGVIVGLAQNFPGSNNVPLLVREGNFGTRFEPEASASRYIYTHGSDALFDLFSKSDAPVLKKQTFEGMPIEPMYYVPNLPVLLLNGSEGLSSGFAQKILPRDPAKVKQYIVNYLQGKGSRWDFAPYFEGFRGAIEQLGQGQYAIKGTVERKGPTKVMITEVPVGYTLKGYIKVLDELEDAKVIRSYRDVSEYDVFKFEVTIPSESLKQWDDETLLAKLKLIKKVTENYTALDDNNKVIVAEDAKDLMHRYIAVKMQSLGLRKANMIEELSNKIALDKSKYLFVKGIVDETIKVAKRKKDAIVKDLQKIDGIIPRDGSYDYLLNMSIHSLTDERLKRLAQDIKDALALLKEIQSSTLEQMWLKDLGE